MSNSPVVDSGEGRDLYRIVQETGPLPVYQAVDYLIQAARSLEAAHAEGIVYRDVGPANLAVESPGIVRVLDLDRRITDADHPANAAGNRNPLRDHGDVASLDFMAPELANGARQADLRADIYSLGCTLYFLLTGRAPFAGEMPDDSLRAHPERHAPPLRTSRPSVSARLEACYKKMTAKQPDDRPRSMTEVISLLQASQVRPGAHTSETTLAPKSQPWLSVARLLPEKTARFSDSENEPSLRVRREESAGLAINREFSLEDPATDETAESPRDSVQPPAKSAALLTRSPKTAYHVRPRQTALAFFALASGLFLAILVGTIVMLRPRFNAETTLSPREPAPVLSRRSEPVNPPRAQAVTKQETIFDGRSTHGWMLCNRASVPARNIQPDGLNPHRTGSYLVVYERKFGDFVLDFDYKLARGCSSGVFLRLSDLNDPVRTGIKVSLSDTRHGDDRDSGGFFGLIAPGKYAQKPAGQWNHMTITADGPRLTVSLNGKEVSSIDLDSWTPVGNGRDNSDDSLHPRPIAHMARIGYLGFQDLGSDCWFNDVTVKTHVP